MESYQAGRGWGRMGEKVQGLRSTIGRYKIDRGVLSKWRSQRILCTTHGHELRGRRIVRGKEGGRRRGKVQGIRSINGRHKIDGDTLRIVYEKRSQRTYMYNHPWIWTIAGNMGGRGRAGWSGVNGGKWDNCNSIINKYIFLKRRAWQEVFKVMKIKDVQTRLLYPAKLSFRIEGRKSASRTR